jgi:hypothetical protein
MASMKRKAYDTDYNTLFWLEKLGFFQIENNNTERYKYTWKHPDVDGFHFHTDKSHGHLFDISANKQHPGYIFHPKDLDEELIKLSPKYISKITDLDKELCSIDLSIKHTKLAIEEFEKSKTGDAREDLKLQFIGVGRYRGYENLTSYLKRCHINGTRTKYLIQSFCYDFDARRQPKELLDFVDEFEIADFIRFFMIVSNLNAKFQPSNYGNQDQDLRLHLEMLRSYKDCIIGKMMKYDNYDGQYDDIIAEMKSDDRDDKIVQILVP